MLTFYVTVERVRKNRMSQESQEAQLQHIADSAKRNATVRWETKIPKHLQTVTELSDRTYRYTAVIVLTKSRYMNEDAVRKKFDHTKRVMARAANHAKWTLVGDEAMVPDANGTYQVVNGAGEVMGDPAPRLEENLVVVNKPSVYVAPGTEMPPLDDATLKRYFSKIYDRESHIRLIYDNLRTAVRTGFKTRHHILLKGQVSCAKTELFLAFVQWMGEELFEEVDASTMTKAGLERLLLTKAKDGTLKPILVMEEIEKCHPDNVSCLMQVMDGRGKIQRVNANTVRDGESVADCKIIVWGTCNDEDELKKFHKGAIWSRFGANRFDCDRPNRDRMKKILLREVEEIDGKVEWIEPVLTFCYDELASIPRFQKEYNDPRLARAMLAGGDRLLDTGKTGYFADFRHSCTIKDVIEPFDPVIIDLDSVDSVRTECAQNDIAQNGESLRTTMIETTEQILKTTKPSEAEVVNGV